MKREEIKSKIRESLPSVSETDYGEDRYKDHLMDMYKLYLEMTDRISQRRSSANTWFLTLNTALLTAIGLFLTKNIHSFIFVLISIAGIVVCYQWHRLIISYKQMNTGRFNVILAIEEMLPLKIYSAEWIALGEGKDPEIYKPFTDVEKRVPIVFGWLYFGMIVAYVTMKFF